MLIVLVVAASALSGCLDVYVATVPDAVLTGGWEETGRRDGERWAGLSTQWAEVTYKTDPAGGGRFGEGPYPASLSVISVSTGGPSDREKIAANLDAQIRDNAQGQDLALDDASRREGERKTDGGLTTRYFTYHATIGAGSTLFQQGQEARVIGEVWYDEPSRITVIAVGLAQIQGRGALGQSFIDDTNWARIVADPSGTIEDHAATDGLIYNVVSHD